MVRSPLAWGSFLLLAGSLLSNFTNYLFNLFMGRYLGPERYGILAALVSVLAIVSVPSAAITTTVAKFSSEYKTKKEWGKLALLFRRLGLSLFAIGSLVFLCFFLGRAPVGGFLKIVNQSAIVILGAVFLIAFPSTLSTGALVGLQKFTFISLNSIFAGSVKLFFGVFLVVLGMGVEGAMLAIFFSMLFPYLLTFWPLGFLLRRQEEAPINWQPLWRYALPVLATTLGLTLLTTTDIVLVKRFFPPYEAGIYSALSLIGRVIFFAVGPIATVMFSLVSERHTGERRYSGLFLASLLLTATAAAAITVFYTLFPNFSVRFFFGEKYLAAAPYLWLFAVFISLYSLCSLLTNFFLSIKAMWIALLPFPASLLQMVLIYLFHQSFLDVLKVSTAVTALLLFLLLISYFRVGQSSVVNFRQVSVDN